MTFVRCVVLVDHCFAAMGAQNRFTFAVFKLESPPKGAELACFVDEQRVIPLSYF